MAISAKPVPVINMTEEAVPPFGLMEMIDVTEDLGLAEIQQPSGGDVSRLVVNGSAAIPSRGKGTGYRAWPTKIAYQPDNENAADPRPAEVWGPRRGSWFLHRDRPGFRIVGGAAWGVVNAMLDPVRAPRRFRIEEVLFACGSALAREMLFDRATGKWCREGHQFHVYDGLSLVDGFLEEGTRGGALHHFDSDRWEVIAIGNQGCCDESGSGDLDRCISRIGGVEAMDLPPFDPDPMAGEVWGIGVQDGCLVRIPTKKCRPESGSGG